MTIKVKNINGLLGTLIFHLAIAISFFSFKITEINEKIEKKTLFVEIDTKDIVIPVEQKKQEIEGKETMTEKMMIQKMAAAELLKDLRNTPVNVSNTAKSKTWKEEDLKPDNYLQNVKNELGIKDEYKNVKDFDANYYEQKKQQKKEIKPAAEYKGPTTITYDLKNRHHTYLHIPVYLCDKSGKVTVDIKVDRSGSVVGATINQSQTEVFFVCLLEAAIKSAIRTRFNGDIKAAERQEGIITYVFLPQN